MLTLFLLKRQTFSLRKYSAYVFAIAVSEQLCVGRKRKFELQ